MDKVSRALLTHSRVWYIIDAKQQRPGRLASQIVKVLQGKHKPIYCGGVDCGDHVVVINADAVEFSGAKWDKKLYRHHTGFPGGFRERLAKKVHDKNPQTVLKKATSGMLPKNRLRPTYMSRLHLFTGEEHPYQANITADITQPLDSSNAKVLAGNILRPPGELEELINFDELELISSIPMVKSK
eukprot:m.28704 g.28704  ORF g.28704 m.28704 type:complete len:185 (-) comp15958_c1_seq1:69-623(-)